MERTGTAQQRTPLLPSTQKVALRQPTITEDDVRRRAYEVYLKRGNKPGNQVDDWLQAEMQLRAN